MTEHEESRYHRRVAMFHQALGMRLVNAQQLAERLFDRDRHGDDDRHSCAECAHLRQTRVRDCWGDLVRGAAACGAGQLVLDMEECLHHCAHFAWQTPPGQFEPVREYPIARRPRA